MVQATGCGRRHADEATSLAHQGARGRLSGKKEIWPKRICCRVGAASTRIHPTAVVHRSAHIGAGTIIGPYAVIGEHVRIGRRCRVGASAVVDGRTEIGDDTEIFPFASIGLIPQDLKFRGEQTRLTIGSRNIFREFVTIHRGTRGGGGVTSIGDRNVFMAYSHVAHDCWVGNDTIFGNNATLGGRHVEDFATISAGWASAVLPHRPARLVGGYSRLKTPCRAPRPWARARIYGLNTIRLIATVFRGDSQQAQALVSVSAAVG